MYGERRTKPHILTASTSFRGDERADGRLVSLVPAKEACCVFGFDWSRLVFTSSPVGLCPHCGSCDQDHVCFSIALYHLKSCNDIYTDWSLYHKFVAKISAQTNNIKNINIQKTLICTHRHPSYYYPCLHAYTNMYTHNHKHLPVFV